ncbi:MAG TPA: efflux RND transporter permease subunit, partial [Chromatiales bacterium]|nr:efflux RND transporter permease subunit [Chromatiales bacterium]
MTAPKIRLVEHTGGLAAWSIRHPVGVVMITLAVMVLGLFALERLGIDLLPHIIYPEIRVRVVDPGVPAKVMEDKVTRQLEEQLAITEDAIYIQSRTREGRSSVDLSFAYGTDIDQALRDASTRLDRAKRFLPTSIEPPIIYKRDPSQRPVAEFAVSSPPRDPVELRSWVDYTLGKWLVNLPGVAAAEVGGGLVEEIQVLADQQRLAGLGLDILDIGDALEAANVDVPSGRLQMADREISGRTAGRFQRLDELTDLPIVLDKDGAALLRLGEVTKVIEGAEEERLRIRLNGVPGVKLSIQKQPRANTVTVVEEVQHRIDQLHDNNIIPPEIEIHPVDDEARYVRQALNNAINAAVSGALLAMLVVYLFLGSVRRTLIIGSAIPIAILVTFILMTMGGLTLNIMTLGGLALGIGMLVDSTIVMLENIYRHQRLHPQEPPEERSRLAAAEVNSAIVASTTTNLAAVLPFLFIGGLVGLLFRELIFTISAAILASLVVALTLVPALSGRIPAGQEGGLRRTLNRIVESLQAGFGWVTARLLKVAWLIPLLFIAGLAAALPVLQQAEEIFLPKMDEGRVSVRITAEQGISLARMDEITRRVEAIIQRQPEVESYFTQVGGFVFGRSRHEAPNRAGVQVILKPLLERGGISSEDWIERVREEIRKARLIGARVRLYSRGIRGIRMSQGDDDITLRILGPDLETLETLAAEVTTRLRDIEGLRNVWNTAASKNHEISVVVDRERAASFDLSVEEVGRVLKAAIGGIKSTDFIKDDRSLDVRLRLERSDIRTPADVASIVLFSNTTPRAPLRLGDIAEI